VCALFVLGSNQSNLVGTCMCEEARCVCVCVLGERGEEMANSFGTINGLGLGFGVKYLLAKMSNVLLKLDRVCCKE
jgi:hypothetical protein